MNGWRGRRDTLRNVNQDPLEIPGMSASDEVSEPGGASLREALLALFASALVASVFLWPVVFLGQVPVPGDAVATIEPWQSEGGNNVVRGTTWNPLITDALWQVVPDAIAAHRLWSEGPPLWAPNNACGLPALAQGRMYSNLEFNLISRLIGPVPALGWTALIQLTIALWGPYLLLRQLGAIAAAAAVAAVAFGLNLYLVVWLPLTFFFGAMVWLPLVFFCFERSLATGRLFWLAIGAGVFAVQILEGQLSTPFLGAVTLGLWSVARALFGRGPNAKIRDLVRPVAAAAGMLVTGALLVAPQVLATVELFLQSPRGEAIGRGSVVPLEQGLRIVAPWFWGYRFHGGTYFGPYNVAELGLYFGIAPLALMVLAPLTRQRVAGWFFLTMTAACGLVVFQIPPLRAVMGWIYPILYQSFPGRVFFIAAFAGSVAAGLGAHWLLAEAQRQQSRRWVIGLLTFTAIAWLAAGWVALVHWPRAVVEYGSFPSIAWLERLRVEGLLWAGLWALSAAVAVHLFSHRMTWRPWLIWAPALVTAIDLVHLSTGVTPFFLPRQILPSTPTVERLQKLVAGSDHASRILPLPSQHMIPGQVPTALELPSPSAYSSWPLRRYDRYASLTQLRYLDWPFIYFNDCCTPLINDLACRWVVAPAGLQLRSNNTQPSTLRLIADGPVKIWENLQAQPRARVVYQVRRAPIGDQDEVVRILTAPGFHDRSEAVVESEADRIGIAGTDVPATPAKIVGERPTRLEVEVNALHPGLLVLADTWYPGWQATVDGEPAAVHPVNLALRGVVVPAGRSAVVFVYRPNWIAPGFLLFLVGVVGLIWMVRRSEP